VHLKAAREQIVRCLVDADVRFDAADEHLPRLVAFEFGDELSRAAGTERRLLNRLNRIGQDGANLCGRAPQALRVLFGDDDGDARSVARRACFRVSCRKSSRETFKHTRRRKRKRGDADRTRTLAEID
jgi:hypothetical protein